MQYDDLPRVSRDGVYPSRNVPSGAQYVGVPTPSQEAIDTPVIAPEDVLSMLLAPGLGKVATKSPGLLASMMARLGRTAKQPATSFTERVLAKTPTSVPVPSTPPISWYDQFMNPMEKLAQARSEQILALRASDPVLARLVESSSKWGTPY